MHTCHQTEAVHRQQTSAALHTWKSRALTMTRSPTVRLPVEMPCAVSTMAAAREELSTTFWPQLRALRLICVFSAAASYSATRP